MLDSKILMTEIAIVVSGCLALIGVLISDWHRKIVAHSLSVVALLVALYWQDATFPREFTLMPAVILSFYWSTWTWQPTVRRWQKVIPSTVFVICIATWIVWHAWSTMDRYIEFFREQSPAYFIGQSGIPDEGLWLLTAFNLLAACLWLMKERAVHDK